MTKQKAHSEFVVFLVDGSPRALRALTRLIQTAGYKTKAYLSPEKFLAEHDPSVHGCIVLEFSMPQFGGLRIQELLTSRGHARPIIFVTGEANVSASVQAMKAGAVDFLLKPIHAAELFDAIELAEKRDCAHAERRAICTLFGKLSSRERAVLCQVVAGRQSKQIAHDLGITEKTTKTHRSHILKKLGVKHMAQLVRMVDKMPLPLT